LPSVGVKSPTYPINNQREGFRGVVEPEVKDLNFLLDQINSAVARRQISASFDNSISMDVDDVSEVKREVSTKNILEESINDVVSDFGSSSR
jgi:ribosome maturation factor RimP